MLFSPEKEIPIDVKHTKKLGRYSFEPLSDEESESNVKMPMMHHRQEVFTQSTFKFWFTNKTIHLYIHNVDFREVED